MKVGELPKVTTMAKLDAMMEKCDSVHSRMDALEKRFSLDASDLTMAKRETANKKRQRLAV
jgi:hypothetical protein